MRNDRALVTFSFCGAEKFAPGTRFVQLHLVQGHAGEDERKAPGRNRKENLNKDTGHRITHS